MQGLRAIAVGLVVLYHLYPGALPGGYVGVDVFFVISGYLITGLLLRSSQRDGRVRLLTFYARRARRLMPAAVLVLTVTWWASRAWLPSTELAATADQIRASALYLQNWTLSHNAVDYLQASAPPTPVQHFWSLSLEEQFYLVWPLLFVVAALAARAARRRDPALVHRAVLVVLGVGIVAASLWFSAHETATNPAAAYFVTPTRMWELGLGGLIALLPHGLARRLARVGVLAWAGLALIVFSAFDFNAATAFPGTIALIPVCGAALMLACGPVDARLGTSVLTARRPMTFLGDISYSLYLWHWPVIVLWTAWSGHGIGLLDGPMIIAVSVVLAWGTKTIVEDGVRLSPALARRTGRSLATALLAAVPVTLVTVFLLNQPSGAVVLDAVHPGAGVLAGTAAAPPDAAMLPPLDQALANAQVGAGSNCLLSVSQTTPQPCTFGDTGPGAGATIALVGDSHAAQWSGDLSDLATQEHWTLVEEAKGSCPFTATPVVPPGATAVDPGCLQWSKQVLTDLETTIKPSLVIVSEFDDNGTASDHTSDAASQQAIAAGMETYFRALTAHGIPVVAIQATPLMAQDVPDCLAGRTGSVSSCSTPAATAIPPDPPEVIASAALNDSVPVVDMNSLICSPQTCAPVVGNVVVYRDSHHLTQAYTQTLEPFLAQRLLAVPSVAALLT